MEFEESIWLEKDDIFYDRGTMTFQMFYLNPMASEEEQIVEIDRVLQDLTIRLDPWTNHYIWDSSPIKFHKNKTNDSKYDYIYGELIFGDSFQDEWLITSILFDLSKTYEDLFIHIMDNDGEFLLIEGYEQLPEWLSPENGRFRDWINHGRILVVPEEYYKDRGLKLNEALKFLERAVYRCEKVTSLDEIVTRRIRSQPREALEAQCGLDIEIPRNIAGYLMRDNILNQVVSEYSKDINIDISTADNEEIPLEDIVELNLRTTVLCYLFIDYELKAKNLKDNKADGGKFVSKIMNSYFRQNKIKSDYLPTDDELKEFNSKGDILQKELIRLMRIDKYIEPKLVFEPPLNNNINEDELMEKVENFFKDNDAGLNGIDNDIEKSNSVNENSKNIRPKIDVIESDDEDDKDQDEEQDNDETAKKFLKKANVDIDEDDFFEYFAKEALKLTDEDLEAFRNMNLKDNNIGTDGEKQNNDDFDYNEEEEEMEELLKNLNSEDLKSMSELFKQLQSSNNPGGPASTFFQNL